MASQKTEDTISYRVGFTIGGWLYKLGAFLVSLIWCGTVKACGLLPVLGIVYGSLGMLLLGSIMLLNDYIVMTIIIFLVILTMGIWVYIKEYPLKKQRKYFKRLFQEIGLHSANGTVPYLLYEENKNEFTTIFAFRSLVPSTMWSTKKEVMELHMNVKIREIKTDPKDNRISYLVIAKKDLPSKIAWKDENLDTTDNILSIGVCCYGFIGLDLENFPHAFIAGETGSGKSNLLKCLVHQSLLKDYEVVLIDFKRGVSFSQFEHSVKICFEHDEAAELLENMVAETKERLDNFRAMRVDNIIDYNEITGKTLKRKVIFIDELAELLQPHDKDLYKAIWSSLETLTRLSRATGIHLIMGLQRPDSTIVNGQIKNNVSFRICGRFVDKEPSRIVLGCDMATELPAIKGRMIVKDNDFYEVQTFYFANHPVRYNQERITKERISVAPPPQVQPTAQTESFEFDFSDISQ